MVNLKFKKRFYPWPKSLELLRLRQLFRLWPGTRERAIVGRQFRGPRRGWRPGRVCHQYFRFLDLPVQPKEIHRCKEFLCESRQDTAFQAHLSAMDCGDKQRFGTKQTDSTRRESRSRTSGRTGKEAAGKRSILIV